MTSLRWVNPTEGFLQIIQQRSGKFFQHLKLFIIHPHAAAYLVRQRHHLLFQCVSLIRQNDIFHSFITHNRDTVEKPFCLKLLHQRGQCARIKKRLIAEIAKWNVVFLIKRHQNNKLRIGKIHFLQ